MSASTAAAASTGTASPTGTAGSRTTYTVTFGEQVENHAGMERLGQRGAQGFTPAELRAAAAPHGGEVLDLRELLPADVQAADAALLVLRGGADKLLGDGAADRLLAEQLGVHYDREAWMYGRVVQKRARHNVCFSDEAQDADLAQRKGTVVAFDDVPVLAALRAQLGSLLGPKAEGLKAEGNCYYDSRICGIGYHGDAERRVVVGLRLGASLPLCYSWFKASAPIGRKLSLELHHGDVYVMSEKTTGCDWRKKTIPTLRHAAGCAKYTSL